MGTKDGGYSTAQHSTAKSCWLQRMTALVIVVVVVLVVMVVVKLTQMSSHYQ
ncbi:MAG: hypothetical protein H9847_08340 [Candidatus Anaerobiospirillum pullicola]|uniref:Uncharacterized protein n=1 Tax=Candidatus Anaerobiospirillum pullicola TaxID=2838451 RepID=A0A948THP4_9GAMM|nr:hypothetical protein [Candidatus Anaerobiospirillum pullicola]